MMTLHETMIISALRYALDCKTYIPNTTDEYVRNMFKGMVSENFIQVAMIDIDYYRRECKRMKVKEAYDWKPLYEFLQEKYKIIKN